MSNCYFFGKKNDENNCEINKITFFSYKNNKENIISNFLMNLSLMHKDKKEILQN